MASVACKTQNLLNGRANAKHSSRACHVAFTSRTSRLVVKASMVRPEVTRREMTAFGAAAFALSLFKAEPAQAFLGIGEGAAREEAYKNDTAAILAEVNGAIAMDRDDPARDEKIGQVRKDINQWVAKYRRNDQFSGRPSFSNTYSAINALAGHYNSFGTQAPIPRKRLDRLNKELGDAELLLTRNR